MVSLFVLISDPEIDTLYGVDLRVGDKSTLTVKYNTFKGPATITVYDSYNRSYRKSGRSRSGTLQFTIAKATKGHQGVYKVEVKDEQRSEVESRNPVSTSCRVTVSIALFQN